MDKQKVWQVIEELQNKYDKDEEIIIDWWPMNSFEDLLRTVPENVQKLIWEEATNNVKWSFENEVGFIWNAIANEIKHLVKIEEASK